MPHQPMNESVRPDIFRFWSILQLQIRSLGILNTGKQTRLYRSIGSEVQIDCKGQNMISLVSILGDGLSLWTTALSDENGLEYLQNLLSTPVQFSYVKPVSFISCTYHLANLVLSAATSASGHIPGCHTVHRHLCTVLQKQWVRQRIGWVCLSLMSVCWCHYSLAVLFLAQNRDIILPRGWNVSEEILIYDIMLKSWSALITAFGEQESLFYVVEARAENQSISQRNKLWHIQTGACPLGLRPHPAPPVYCAGSTRKQEWWFVGPHRESTLEGRNK
jgi:hypothetical protein